MFPRHHRTNPTTQEATCLRLRRPRLPRLHHQSQNRNDSPGRESLMTIKKTADGSQDRKKKHEAGYTPPPPPRPKPPQPPKEKPAKKDN